MTVKNKVVIVTGGSSGIGEPSEIAETVLFLCSPNSSLITGVALPVDGGYTCV